MIDILLVVASYLAGSISTAVIVSRMMRLPDPRAEGSGNPGATNVLRLGGKKAGAFTLLGDMLKGVIPVLVAAGLVLDNTVIAACAVAAFLGHLYPVFFGFKGGKGVATALGAVAALAWPVGLCMGAAWLVVALLTRYSSLASILCAIGGPFFAAWLGEPISVVVAIAVITVLLVSRHRANIARLLAGEESRIGSSKA